MPRRFVRSTPPGKVVHLGSGSGSGRSRCAPAAARSSSLPASCR